MAAMDLDPVVEYATRQQNTPLGGGGASGAEGGAVRPKTGHFSGRHRYYLVDMPAEITGHPVERGNMVQVFTHDGCGMTYLMDYDDMAQICRQRGWDVPTAGDWCEFPGPLQ